MSIPIWTKADQLTLDNLVRRKAEREHWLHAGVDDLVRRLNIDQYDLVEKLIKNRKAFIEVLERFEEGETP